ncbi:hypothetical protein AB870_10670 [Pandoraea faecigallinarum]|uniref:Bacterial shufflon protein N-terminal domain-containing protein n=1 Tax=Pandoraea faecigallinarum TaxID=656179 RepID=A0A0H3WVA1_9BURK|nr:hypothetical protein [Pandoraea faecigallinarum]AKM30466.1 hypothetical protein AB870_10670 [Pandoraea faecigallinarum]
MRKKQTGAFLISAAIAVAILGVLISFWGVNYARQMRIERAERIGEALKIVGDKVQSFVVEHHHEIDALLRSQNGTFDVGGVTFHHATDSNGAYVGNLTAATLIEATHATGIGERPPGNVGDYVIRIYLGCDTQQTNCNVETLTYIEKPIAKSYSSEPDMDAAAIAARKIGMLGGVSQADGGHAFRFLETNGRSGTVENFATTGGLVAMRGGYSSSAADVYLRRDGSRAMTGDLKMDKHAIVGAGKIAGQSLEVASATVTGPVDMGGATIRGTLNLTTDPKTMAQSNIVGAGNIEGDGTLKMRGIDVTTAQVKGPLSASSVKVDGKVSADNAETRTMKSGSISADTVTTTKALKSGSGVVVLEKEYSVGGACGGVGGIDGSVSNGIALDAGGRVLSCQGGVWKLASAPKSITEVPDPIIQVIRKNEAMWLSVFKPGRNQGMSRVEGALACAHVDMSRSDLTSQAFLMAGGNVGSPEITLMSDGSISFYRSGLGVAVACLSRSSRVKGRVYSMTGPSSWTYLTVAPREQFASDSFEFQDRAAAIFTRRPQEHIVMGIWNYAWANCSGSYRSRMKGALACTVTERSWCYATSGGSKRASVEIDTDGTPIVDFGNTYGEVTCAFPTKADALAAGFSICNYDGNNCASKW